MTADHTSIIFPHSTLTVLPNHRSPTPQDIQALRREVQENLMAIETPRGGGDHGFLALSVTPAEYLIISNNILFIAPAHPGLAPVHAAGATQFQITETNRQFQANCQEYELYQKVKLLVKTQILKAVPKQFTEALEDLNYGYNNVTILQLMTHLNTKYGKVTRTALEANFAELDRVWDTELEISTYFNAQRKIQQFAQPHNPITNDTLLMKAIAAIRNTGLFERHLETFDLRPTAEQTYDQFKTDFEEADKLYRIKLTTTNVGYHSANAAMTTKESKTVSTKQPTQSTTNTDDIITNNGIRYCWTHSIMHNKMYNAHQAHTSAECKYPAKGHVKEATFLNMCSGNNFMRRNEKEKAVFQYVPRDKEKESKRKRKNTPEKIKETTTKPE